MSARSVETSLTPQVFVEAVYGDLQIKGWSRSEVLVKSSDDEGVLLVEQDEALRVRSRGDCSLHLPVGASITITSVYGGVGIRSVEGALNIGRVLGSLQLLDVGEATIDSVYGELRLGNVAGAITVGQVLGNTIVRDVQGNCSLERVAGNLDLCDALGEIRASVGGNARLRLGLLPGERYQIDSGGEIYFRIPEDADAQVSLSCGAGKIRVDLPAEKNVYLERVHQLMLGNGKVKIDLSAGGAIVFEAKEADWAKEEQAELKESLAAISEDFSEQITGQIETQIQSQMKILDEQMSHLSAAVTRAGLSAAESERITRQARQASERASARAQEKMQRARERLDRKLAAAQRRVEQKERSARRRKDSQVKGTTSNDWPTPPVPPTPPGYTQVTDEERLIILHMLAQKKITLAEAEQLLAALEEKGE